MKAITDENVLEQLEKKTTIDPVTDCWLHSAVDPSRQGYARIRLNGKDRGVHIISAYKFLNYMLDIDDPNYQVNHKCNNRNCWNPEHLYIGTQKENVKDAMDSGKHMGALNSAKTHCPAGHPYDKVNTEGRRICTICQKETSKKHNINYRST